MTEPAKRSGPPSTRRGYDAYECVSALQKTVRRSDLKGSVYWAVELDESGHTAWAWKRIKTIATEDIGPAAPGLAADVRALFENWKEEGGTGGMYLMHAVLLCANAPKSRAACWGTIVAASDYHDRLDIPDCALDRHTRRGLRMGRGGWTHFMAEAATLIDPAPGSLADYEAEMAGRFEDHANGLAGLPANPWRERNQTPVGNLPTTPTTPPRATSEQQQMSMTEEAEDR